MKIIFLDFDGVIIHTMQLMTDVDMKFGSKSEIDNKAIMRLNQIVAATGAKVVITSSMRKIHSLDELRSRMLACGFRGEVIDMTPDLGSLRGIEIQSWLDAHEQVTNFVIID